MALTLTVVDSFATPSSVPSGIAVDGAGRMWVNDFSSGTIYEVDPADGSTVTSYAAPAGNPRGMAWDGTYLRVLTTAGVDAIHRVNVATGAGVDSISPLPGSIRQQLAWNTADSTLWMSDTGNVNDEPVININSSTGAEIDRFLVEGVPGGLFVHDGFVYLINTGSVTGIPPGGPRLVKHDPSDGSVLDFSNQITGGPQGDTLGGCAFDGSHIWLVSNTDDRVYKIGGFVGARGLIVGSMSLG